MDAIAANIGVVLLFLGAGLGIYHYVQHHAKQRRIAMQGVARRRGWLYTETVGPTTWQRWGKFGLFERGRRQKLINLISGKIDGLDCKIFDYQYTTSGGKNSNTHHQTVACVCDPGLDLPAFELCPENLGHRLISMFGYQDIDFAANPTFSKQFLLRGEHENRVRKLFSNRLRRELESRAGWSIEGQGHCLLIFRQGESCDAGEITARIREVIEIAHDFQKD